ncbi:MAG: FtsX-like permease family protein [Puia sp.]
MVSLVIFISSPLNKKSYPIVLINPAISSNQSYFNSLSVKVNGKNIKAELATIEKAWTKYLPEIPYQYSFLDEHFASLYESEQRQGTIFTVFACIAIFIASLGLFGLSAFAITQRIKEIGIRKVLGARVDSIVALLSRDFLKLVLIAAIIAFFVAWFIMSRWLQDFAYRISIQWWVFALSAFLALIVALATVSSMPLKRQFPIRSLV